MFYSSTASAARGKYDLCESPDQIIFFTTVTQILWTVHCNEEDCELQEGEVRGDGVGGQGASAYSKITGVAVTPTLDGAPSS